MSARRAEALPRVFDSFLRELAEQEDEAWEHAREQGKCNSFVVAWAEAAHAALMGGTTEKIVTP